MSPTDATEIKAMKEQISNLEKRIAVLESVLQIGREGSVSLTSGSKILIKGLTIEVISRQNMKIRSDGILDIEGSIVNVN
jgi:hypothetical protein